MRSALPIFVRTAVFVFFFAASAVRTTLYVEEAQLREAVKAHEAALPAFGPVVLRAAHAVELAIHRGAPFLSGAKPRRSHRLFADKDRSGRAGSRRPVLRQGASRELVRTSPRACEPFRQADFALGGPSRRHGLSLGGRRHRCGLCSQMPGARGRPLKCTSAGCVCSGAALLFPRRCASHAFAGRLVRLGERSRGSRMGGASLDLARQHAAI